MMKIIQTMLDRRMEETRHVLQGNPNEPTTSIMQCELEEEQSEEGITAELIVKLNPDWLEETIRAEGLKKIDASIRTSWHPSRQVFLEAQHQ